MLFDGGDGCCPWVSKQDGVMEQQRCHLLILSLGMTRKTKDAHVNVNKNVNKQGQQYLTRASQYFLAYSFQVPNLLGNSASICMKSCVKNKTATVKNAKLPVNGRLIKNNQYMVLVLSLHLIFAQNPHGLVCMLKKFHRMQEASERTAVGSPQRTEHSEHVQP